MANHGEQLEVKMVCGGRLKPGGCFSVKGGLVRFGNLIGDDNQTRRIDTRAGILYVAREYEKRFINIWMLFRDPISDQ